jgi:hypothetical protein
MEQYQYGLGDMKLSVPHVYGGGGKVYKNLCSRDAFPMIRRDHVIFICWKQHKISAL